MLVLFLDGHLRNVLRRGKALVRKAFISEGSDENEFGQACVERLRPFTSRSSDVLPSTCRCNADCQFQAREVPPCNLSGKDGADTDFSSRLFYGCRKLSAAGKRVLIVLATAMRAANVTDFYMTKYQAKSQEMLAPAIVPLERGLSRLEEQEQEEKEARAEPSGEGGSNKEQ